MANIKSQIKRIGTNEKRRLRNKAAKSEIKTRIKAALRSAELGDEAAAEHLRIAVKRLDKAAARGIIHRNQAANRKSAVMAKVAHLRAAQAEAEEAAKEVPAATVDVEEAHAARSARRRPVPPRARRGRRSEASSGAAEELQATGDADRGVADEEAERPGLAGAPAEVATSEAEEA